MIVENGDDGKNDELWNERQGGSISLLKMVLKETTVLRKDDDQ